MKRIVIASAVLALFAGAASASNQINERPDRPATAMMADQTVKVQASEVYNNKDLQRMNLKPNQVIELSVLPSSGIVERPSRDD